MKKYYILVVSAFSILLLGCGSINQSYDAGLASAEIYKQTGQQPLKIKKVSDWMFVCNNIMGIKDNVYPTAFIFKTTNYAGVACVLGYNAQPELPTVIILNSKPQN